MLARQIAEVATQLAARSGITVGTVLGGTRYDDAVRTQIVVASPGKCVALLKNKKLLGRDIRMFVLDEADDLVENFELATRDIRKALPRDVQVLLFSASFTSLAKKSAGDFASFLLSGSRGEPARIEVKSGDLAVERLHRFFVECGDDEKFGVMCDVYTAATIGRTIVFVNTRARCAWLAKELVGAGFAVGVMSSDQKEAEQESALRDFKSGATKVLVATGMVERGIDVAGVSLVVNYDMPLRDGKLNMNSYQHRCGRAARFGAAGIVIDFVCDGESRAALDEIKRHFGVTMAPLDVLGMAPEDLTKRLAACLT